MSSSAYEENLRRLGSLVGELGIHRASELTLLASDPVHPAPAAGTEGEREFVRLMAATLNDVASDRQRFLPHS